LAFLDNLLTVKYSCTLILRVEKKSCWFALANFTLVDIVKKLLF
jgi:hypothetical protein